MQVFQRSVDFSNTKKGNKDEETEMRKKPLNINKKKYIYIYVYKRAPITRESRRSCEPPPARKGFGSRWATDGSCHKAVFHADASLQKVFLKRRHCFHAADVRVRVCFAGEPSILIIRQDEDEVWLVSKRRFWYEGRSRRWRHRYRRWRRRW